MEVVVCGLQRWPALAVCVCAELVQKPNILHRQVRAALEAVEAADIYIHYMFYWE